jgi:chemotaxis protein histidine kinase CheA
LAPEASDKDFIREFLLERAKEKSRQLEMAMTILLHKAFGKRYIIVRSSKYDDYNRDGGIDNVLVDKETGTVICGFDEVRNNPKSHRKAEKGDKVLERARAGGTELIYGLSIDEGKMKLKSMSNLPLFFLSLDEDEYEELIGSLQYGERRYTNLNDVEKKYIENDTNNLFSEELIPFTMSEEQQPLATTPQTPAQESTDLLRQTDLLATQNKEYAARLAEMERKFQEAENAKKLYAASMVETAKPQFDRYKQYWEKTQGKPMPDNLAQTYLATFVDPAQKDAKAIIVKEMEEAEKTHQQTVSVAASLAELKKELEAVKAERVKLEETVAKATEAPSTRATYARALDAQQQHTQELSTAAGASIPEGEIPVPPPCNSMLPFLQAAGRCATSSNQLGVVAGADGLLPMLRSVPAPPTHDQLVGKDGKLNFPFSLRYSDAAAFSYMTNGPLATAPTELLESISNPVRSKSSYDAKYTNEAKFLE